MRRITLVNACGVKKKWKTKEDGVQLNAETSIHFMLINYKENDMTVWPQEHEEPDENEEDIHSLTERDYKVLEYFVNTVVIMTTSYVLYLLIT